MVSQLSGWARNALNAEFGCDMLSRLAANDRIMACFHAAQHDPSSQAAQSLDLSGLRDLGFLPGCIGELAHLRELLLTGCDLVCLPETLPPSLTSLVASNNHLTSLPDNLPPNLERLYVELNRLSNLPETLPLALSFLEASNNHLTRLPDNLPPNLEELFVDQNHLSNLPESLPPTLMLLMAGNSRLANLPVNLPPNLEGLVVDHNLLTNLPETLPPNLSHLNASNNRLTSLPANLPGSLQILDARSNPVTSLPEDILTLPGTCHIAIDGGFLSAAVRSRLEATMSRPDYSNVRINFSEDTIRASAPPSPPQDEGCSLQEAVASWVPEADGRPGFNWSSFQAERYAQQFSQFLGRLRETSDYRNAASHVEFKRRVGAFLDQIKSDPELRATCFNLAQDAVDTCGDRVALRFLDMEAAGLDKQMATEIGEGKYDSHPNAVTKHCLAQYRRQVLADAATRKIQTLNYADEIEVRLGHLVAFGREFPLPANANGLLYGACSMIEPQDVFEIRKQLTNTEFDDTKKDFYRPFFRTLGSAPVERLNALPPYRKSQTEMEQFRVSAVAAILNSSAMGQLLSRLYPAEAQAANARIEQEVARQEGELSSQLEALNPEGPDYAAQLRALSLLHERLHAEVNVKEKMSLWLRLCSEHGVVDDLN